MTTCVGPVFVCRHTTEGNCVPISEGDVHELFSPFRRTVSELHDVVGRMEEMMVELVVDRELDELEQIIAATPMPHPEPDAEAPDFDVARDSERGK